MPEGTQFIVDLGAIHRGPNYSDPMTFNPERFLKRDGKCAKNSFIPFGAGKRNCIGLGFALQILKIAAFRISSNLKIENRERDLRNEMEGVAWRPKSGTLLQRFHYI